MRSRVIATIGLHGSASTWAFNIVRELMIAYYSPNRVASCYADRMRQVSKEIQSSPDVVVVKSHEGSKGLYNWFDSRGAEFVLSIRDPRDSIASMSMRFDMPIETGLIWLKRDCDRIVGLVKRGAIIVKYEDRPFDSLAFVRDLACRLGVTLKLSDYMTIFERYQASSIQKLTSSVSLDALAIVGEKTVPFDPVKLLLKGHIGDTLSGKWQLLPQEVRDRCLIEFEEFLTLFYGDQFER